MGLNCYIDNTDLEVIVANRGTGYWHPELEVEVTATAMQQLAQVSKFKLYAWTVAGFFGDNVRRVGTGTRGSYYLYRLVACYRQIKDRPKS
jgi:hypothetical protein